MKRKQGFTLIELLAIIVILAIIALIAVPVVLNIIDKARISSYERSSENVLEAARLYYSEYKLDKTTDIEGNKYETIKQTLSGDTPDSGEVYIREDVKIALALNYNNTYCYKKDYEAETFEKSEITDGTCKISTGNALETLKNSLVANDSGEDGLYLESDGVYRYKGLDPDNYITIGDETYRILAIEEQGIKVINVSNPINEPFDIGDKKIADCTEETCPRYNSDNTYCQVVDPYSDSYYGCNVYAGTGNTTDLLTYDGNIENGDEPFSGTVKDNSNAYNVLHEYYTNTLSSLEEYIETNATWNVGIVKYHPSKTFDPIPEEEKQRTWQGRIGLITFSEYLNAQLPSGDDHQICSEFVLFTGECGNMNWLKPNATMTTINPTCFYPNSTWSIQSNGTVSDNQVYSAIDLLPVIYLKSDIDLTGSGTSEDAYKIVES